MLSPAARAVRAAAEETRPSWAQAAALVERITMESDLRDALVAGDLVLRYQPIVDLATGRVIAFEALCRWRHWSRGLLAPAEFLPLAEETGLILPLGGWVLEEASRRLALWRARTRDATALAVTVNLSAAELRNPLLADRTAAALDAAGLPADRLVVEVSEAAAYADEPDASARNLGALADLGVGVAIDGLSGRPDPDGWLWRLPLRMVKIDRGVAARGADPDLTAVIGVAAERRILAVAKGVETADQLARLYRLGCPAGQGFLFTRPLDPADAEAYLRRPPRTRPRRA